MNLTSLKQAVAEETGSTLAEADQRVKAVLEAISESLQDGGPVSLTGFGSFNISKRSARIGRNPQTGEEIKIAASNAVIFKVGKSLKDAVNAPKKKNKKKKKKK